jgi:hypothetical protein
VQGINLPCSQIRHHPTKHSTLARCATWIGSSFGLVPAGTGRRRRCPA